MEPISLLGHSTFLTDSRVSRLYLTLDPMSTERFYPTMVMEQRKVQKEVYETFIAEGVSTYLITGECAKEYLSTYSYSALPSESLSRPFPSNDS